MMNRRMLLRGLPAIAMAPALMPSARAAASGRVLTVARRTLEVKGRAAPVFGITDASGRPGLDMVLGEPFRLRLHNATAVETAVHWHGLTPPSEQDGVPMLAGPSLKPGGSLDYDFVNTRSGTHWMHSHVGLQEQQLLAAPLIVRETAAPLFDTQDHVVLLHDFTFRDPQEILAELRGGGGAHAGHATMDHGASGHGQSEAAAPAGTGAMLGDVVFDAYLANDRTLDDPEIVAVTPGGMLRLRIINGAAASNMWIDLGALEGEIVAVDGNAIYPVAGSLFPLAIAQRADIRLRVPATGGAFPVLFRPEGVAARTGIVLATPGAAVARIAGEGAVPPALDLSQELIYRSVARPPQEPVNRTEMLMLTGGEGGGYVWGFNGRPMMHETLFTVRAGERISVMMHNMTGMSHPMHLHGHYFKVTAIGDTAVDGALRDVVLVPPSQSVTITFDADNPGNWAFHCHHAYHMNSGMMAAVAYTGAA